jgi:hypothetical protein
MQELSPKLHRSRWLASASLGAALTLILLGASAPRTAAQSAPQSYNFNNRSDAAWTHFDYGIPPDPNWFYPTNTYSFPTNTAGPAGNYAYRMQLPSYTNDPLFHFLPLGGSFLTGMTYGDTGDSTFGRFSVGSDLIAWNTTSDEMEIGIAWSASIPNLQTPTAYFGGWGPGQNTLGMGVVINGITQFGLIGIVTPGTTVLLANHQYRLTASTYDGSTWMTTIYDVAQPNSPWQSAISKDTSVASFFGTGGGGTVGLMGAILHPMVAPGDFPTQPADATWDNFSVGAIPFVDPSGSVPVNMPATVTDLSPTPAGQSGDYFPTISIGFLNRDTGVNSSGNPTGWVKLYLDGVQIPNNQLTIDPNYVYKPNNNDNPGGYAGPQAPYPTNFPGATVSYKFTSPVASGWHTNTVVFEDDQTIDGTNVMHTTTWSWNAYLPQALNAALSVPGFATRTVVSYSPGDNTYANMGAGGLNNSVASAAAVLAGQYKENLSSTNIAPTVNYGMLGTEYGGTVTNFPGLCAPTAWQFSFAVEAMAYLQLPAGTNVFWVGHDDAVGIYSGQSPTDTGVVLFENNGSSPATFSWYVPAAGLYPIHIIYQEGGPGANLVLASANNGGEGTVVGAAGGIPAYYPVPSNVPPVWTPSSWTNWNLMSSTVVKGLSNYTTPVATTLKSSAPAPVANAVPTLVAGAGCDGTNTVLNQTVTGWTWSGSASGTNTITFAAPSSQTYYRLYGPGVSTILSCQKSNANLVVTYRWQQTP